MNEASEFTKDPFCLKSVKKKKSEAIKRIDVKSVECEGKTIIQFAICLGPPPPSLLIKMLAQ